MNLGRRWPPCGSAGPARLAGKRHGTCPFPTTAKRGQSGQRGLAIAAETAETAPECLDLAVNRRNTTPATASGPDPDRRGL